MVHLSLILMGPFEALLDGQAITAFQSSKVRALLAFLAVEMARPHRARPWPACFGPMCRKLRASQP